MSSIVRSQLMFRPSSQALRHSKHFLRMSLRNVSHSSRLSNETNDTVSSRRALPSEADVVVIGGGMIGSSTTYHLAKMTGGNIIQLEKDKLTSGTTWHTAGLLWQLRPHETELQIIQHTRELMTKVLPEETGLDTGWVPTGGMFIAANKERLDEYQIMSTLGEVFGIESHVLSPEESLKVHPLLDTSDLYGTLYSPKDGTIDPSGACTTLTRAAAKYGAKAFGHHPLAKYLAVDCIVDYVNALRNFQMVGVRVPQVAYKHAYVVTETIDGIKSCPNVRDHDGSVYLKRQGDTLQVGGYEPNPIPWEKIEPNFAFGLFDLDWDVFGQHIEAGCRRIPAIQETGIRSTVCGPESFTADGYPLLGEAPEIRGFYHGSAFNSGGMMMGGGAGKQLAHWIIEGSPQMDMFSMDIKRFPTNLLNEKTWLKERCHESYAKHYSIAFHHDQPLGGRNQRSDPLHEELLRRGCFYEERHGWERPAYFPKRDGVTAFDVKNYDYYGQYGNEKTINFEYSDQLGLDYTFDFPGEVHKQIGHECLTCRTTGAIFNTSYMGKLFLSGPNASRVARRIFSRDVTRRHDKCTYTLMLNSHGGIEADLVVATLKDSTENPVYYLTVGGATTEYCKFHIKKAMQDDGIECTLEDKTDEMGIISVQGMNSRRLLRYIMDDEASVIDDMKFSTWRNVSIAESPALLMRVSFVGELGFELHCSNEHMLPIYQKLREKSLSLGFCDSGYRAMDSLSAEIGFHHWPHSIRSDDSPFEADLTHLCDLDDEDSVFIGKTALLAQRGAALKKKLATFTVDDEIPLFGHEAIWRNGQVVGYLRSAAYAFALGKGIAVGYVTNPNGGTVNEEFIKSGEYKIKRMGVLHKAQVHMTNPFDPKFRRMMGKYDEKEIIELRDVMINKFS